jgi:hypothetical protein
MRQPPDRLLKNGVSGCDLALRGFCRCSHIANMLRFPKRRAPGLPREIRRPFHWGLTA